MARNSAGSVTVVIPVWDHYVQFLPEAVGSVDPGPPKTRIVVADNASTVPIPELTGVSVVRSPERLTVGGVRNFGLEQVDTEYVLVLDADDQLLPGTIPFLLGRLRADPRLSVCTTSVLDGATGERHPFPRRFVPFLCRLRSMFALLDSIWSLFPIQSCALLRTAQVREAGGYADADWGDDWVLAVSLAFRGRVQVDHRLGRYYRRNPDSLSRKRRRADRVASARFVRRRLRRDPAIPAWVRPLIPGIGLLQLSVIYLVHPAYLVARRRQSD
jgi:glycosyltransferase involved in cell wall biosynthesis